MTTKHQIISGDSRRMSEVRCNVSALRTQVNRVQYRFFIQINKSDKCEYDEQTLHDAWTVQTGMANQCGTVCWQRQGGGVGCKSFKNR